MAAETAVLVTIATSLASGLLKEVSKKALDAASESSTVAGLKSAIFGGLETDLRYLEKELCKLDSVLSSAQSIDPMHMHYNDNKLLLIWLGGVKEAACFADNLLDEIAYEKIRKQVQKKTSPFAKFSGFPKRIAGKIKKFVSMTDEIYKEAETTLNLAKLAGKASTATYQPPPTSISENLREIRENPDTSIVVGREADEELIVTKLCRPHNHPDLPVVAIVGRSVSIFNFSFHSNNRRRWIASLHRRPITCPSPRLRRSAWPHNFFGVYDGHCSFGVEEKCKERLHHLVAEEMVEEIGGSGGLTTMDDVEVGARVDWERVMKVSFARMDREVCGEEGEASGGEWWKAEGKTM